MKTKLLLLTVLAVALTTGFAADHFDKSYLLPNDLALAPSQDQLAISLFNAKQIRVTTLQGQAIKKINLERTTGGFLGLGGHTVSYPALSVAYSRDGKSLYATAENGNEGLLFKINCESGRIVKSTVAGNHPMGVIVSADGQSVYVCNRFDSSVQRFDADTLDSQATGKVTREAHACALGQDDKLLFVANHLPLIATEPMGAVSAVVSVLDAKTLRKKYDIPLANGATGVRDAVASPDGRYIYVSHTLARFQLPTTQLERGWMNTAALSVIDGQAGVLINTVLLDDVDLGAANPWAITVTPDGKSLVITHAGTREVSVIDRVKLHKQLDMARLNQKVTSVTSSAADVSYDLSFLSGIRRRITFTADGPRSAVATNDRIYTAAYFADGLVEIPFKDRVVRPRIYPLQNGKLIDLSKDRVLRGEMLFNDASMCFQQWQSCATCHPDGRVDGLNWDLLNDGIGNPKQTKSLYLSGFTPPTMITGIRADMGHCNRAGIRHIQFCTRPEEDPICLDEYVMAMRAHPSPYTRDSAAIARGRKVFDLAGCAVCHPHPADGEDYYTDLKQYDMGLGIRNEVGRKFDTPTLREVWRTAPYLYDGRAVTMMDVLTTCNPKDTHGKTSTLTPQQLKDLEIFVLSL